MRVPVGMRALRHGWAAIHHARADRLVRRFVDQDERARAPVASVLVDDERLRQPEPNDAEVVELHLAGARSVLERVDVDHADDLVDAGRNGSRGVLDQQPRAILDRPLRHPADEEDAE